MSGMKISLDAAMRARDVSSPDWRDNSPADGDETARTADPARPIRTVATAPDTGAPNASPLGDPGTHAPAAQAPTARESTARASEAREPAPNEPVTTPAQEDRGKQRRRGY